MRMAFISQAVPFRTTSICLWSRSRGPAKLRRTSLAVSPLIPPATPFGESPFPRVGPSLAAFEAEKLLRVGLADAQLRRLTDKDAGGLARACEHTLTHMRTRHECRWPEAPSVYPAATLSGRSGPFGGMPMHAWSFGGPPLGQAVHKACAVLCVVEGVDPRILRE